MTITLTGEPKSTQHIYKLQARGGFASIYMSAEGKLIKYNYQKEAREQWQGPPLEGDVELEIVLYFGTKRKADWDNFGKLLGDSLTGIVYNDDSQVWRARVTKDYDKLRPRIEVTIV